MVRSSLPILPRSQVLIIHIIPDVRVSCDSDYAKAVASIPKFPLCRLLQICRNDAHATQTRRHWID